MTAQRRLDRLYTAFNEAPPADRVKLLAGIAGILLQERAPQRSS